VFLIYNLTMQCIRGLTALAGVRPSANEAEINAAYGPLTPGRSLYFLVFLHRTNADL